MNLYDFWVPPIPIKLLSENATIPSDNGDIDNAGYDLYAAHDMVVPIFRQVLVKTDVSMRLPAGHYGRIAGRSGLALKNAIDVMGGVVDRNYSGNIGVILFNAGEADFLVKKGDRIAQIIIEKYIKPGFKVVENLPESKRGDGGFGSTGVK